MSCLVGGCAFSSLAVPFEHSPSILPSYFLLISLSPPFSPRIPVSSDDHPPAAMSDVLSPPSRRRHGRSSSTAVIDIRSIQRSQSYPRPSSSGGLPIYPPELTAESPGASSSRMAASRIVSTMRRPFSARQKRDQSPMDSGMYSTPEESRAPIPSPYSVRDAPRPTIQQIAMGLHVSRTPHLRSPRATSPPGSPRGRSGSQPVSSYKRVGMNIPSRSTPIILPPPPPRSSLKKPGSPTKSATASLTPSTSDLSLTGSTLTMSAPPTPSARSHRAASVSIFPARLQMSMSRILRVPSRKESAASTPLRADDDSMSSVSSESPRKMVRFSSSPVVPRVETDVTF
ncbi:uncharacterized protein C8Q71DRAFT_910049 [Rhodofomes roseus]|uniref:Uncharacterized protein n=1 Tax=Rhodofomes roseus TaxID=34475 RepID=A0ABQ8K6N4_9APHY|nr:uncharacterized protein C8Q71DRAFT_910049 [Rhodofomes roseus]KAH9832535.1 hypothetical protein C8Q71DRAFT_910049 [Rhodofomes roseus]